MLTKKITAALAGLAATLAVSAPAFADNGYHYGHYRHGNRVVVERIYVQPRPVVQHYYYRPAPRPVVVYQPVYEPVYQPRPVYYHAYQTDPATGAAVLVGAVLGAAIVHAAVTGH